MPFLFYDYEHMAALMRSCKSKMMVRITDHLDIRGAFDDFLTLDLSIRHSVNNKNGGPSTSCELVITNREPHTQTGGLF